MEHNKNKEKQLILFFSSCLPRKCGIATFTQDLADAIDNSSSSVKSKFIAINDNGREYDYSDDVIFQINEDNIQD